ncbi:SMP-30/gluconolactonase/LRE family protein [Haloferula sp. A504]|uniref:SMP-30/gluconolactonase/LRE family protein n=1 Tax=Haloferula sp. A504 TaxID=3373601 RepID=UPI0031BC593E|nr:SMP-30/gluconolactonase/LRE family protein [Verrucomicrobiaceae bacterium E54]
MTPKSPAFLLLLGLCTFATHASAAESGSLFVGDPVVISEGHGFAEGMAFDAEGNFYFTDVPAGTLFRVDAVTGEKTLLDGESGKTNGIAIGPDGMLYGCAGGDQRIHRWDLKTGKRSVVAEGPHSNDIAITDAGIIFFTDPETHSVWRVSPAPERQLTKAAALEWKPNGIALNPAGDALFVAEFLADTVHRLPLADDGSLGAPRPAYRLATGQDGRGLLDGMVVLPSGHLLIGTALGIQLVPPLSAKAANFRPVVVPPFGDRPRCNYVRLSPDGKTLYAAFRDDILKLAVRKGAIE